MSGWMQYRWRFWIEWPDGRIYDDPDKGKFTFALERPGAVRREAYLRAKALESKGLGKPRVMSSPPRTEQTAGMRPLWGPVTSPQAD